MGRVEIFDKVKMELEALALQKIEDPDQEIFRVGLIDSVNILSLVTFIETEFNLTLDPFEVNLESLGSINKICDFIMEKKTVVR